MSLVARHRLDKVARMFYGEANIEDLWTSFFCISCNLSTGREKVHQQGQLWKAIRATTALPGVFAPFVEDQHLLVDGGLLDNLPYTTMQDLDAGVMILVDISSSETLTVAFPYEEMPTSWQVARSWLNPFAPTLKVPTLPDMLMRTVTVSSLGKQQQARDAADLMLRPPVDDFGMLESTAMDALIECGYAYTKERLATWPGRNLWHKG